MDKTIVLFDMDGTLTEPRQSFNLKELTEALYQLTNCGVHIGIITGSDENYLREQMGSFLSKSSSRYKTHLLPCNGTKYLKPPEFANEDFKLSHQVCMKQKLGETNYRKLINELILSQVHMSSYGIPLTGHFIDCRGSMINWSPIGRNANSHERNFFKILDKEQGIRKGVIEELDLMLEQYNLLSKIKIKFGGDTSFDIYPKGWDKTYGLRHFEGWNVWFVGDRCEQVGNDYEIYTALSHLGRSFKTSGPQETVEVIKTIIKKIKEDV